MPLLLFILLWVLTCIGAEYPNELVLQHIPTAIVVMGLFVARRRRWLSPISEWLVLLFMTLHLFGARYLYSYVPYDDWSYWLSGKTVSGCFGFTRNHYDRLVHFAYGLLLIYPAYEILNRHCHVSARAGGWLALQFILATSALYEIGEWALAISVAPDWAEHYNGQQGDRWDAQKDMALAAAVGLAILRVAGWRRRREPRA